MVNVDLNKNKQKWKGGLGIALSALVPLALVGIMVVWLLGSGGNLLGTPQIPFDELSASKIEFHPNEIQVKVRNTGPDDLTITSVLVNGAIMDNVEINPGSILGRLDTATITVPYWWEEAKPYVISVYTADAFVFNFEAPAALQTPTVSWDYIRTFMLMGTFVGIIPVFLGFLWLPILRKVGMKYLSALVALTVGVLAFLGMDTILEGFELAATVAGVFRGITMLVTGIVLGYFGIIAIESILKKAGGRIAGSGLLLSYMISLGIGIHNMGEGLAIGSAFILGEAALGSLLIIGFTVHNVTEGIAILAPGVNRKIGWGHLLAMGAIAGVPTIAGGMIGGFAYSPVLATLFFGIATGAILQVIAECWSLIRGDGLVQKIKAAPNWIGLTVGFALMYATALFVTG